MELHVTGNAAGCWWKRSKNKSTEKHKKNVFFSAFS